MSAKGFAIEMRDRDVHTAPGRALFSREEIEKIAGEAMVRALRETWR